MTKSKPKIKTETERPRPAFPGVIEKEFYASLALCITFVVKFAYFGNNKRNERNMVLDKRY